MNENISEQIVRASIFLAKMSASERVEFFQSLESLFCRHCGRQLDFCERCHCNNDE